MPGLPDAIARFMCASECAPSTISRSGPTPTAMRAPGLRTRPPTAAPATSFSTRAACRGVRPVTNSSGRPRSCSPIVYAYGRRSSSTPCTAHPCTRIVSRSSSRYSSVVPLGLSHCQHMTAPSCSSYGQLAPVVRQLPVRSRNSRSDAQHRLLSPSVAERRGPRPAPPTVGPHKLQRPNLGAAERDCEIQVRVGVAHLDDLDEWSRRHLDLVAWCQVLACHGITGHRVQKSGRTLRGNGGDRQVRGHPGTEC